METGWAGTFRDLSVNGVHLLLSQRFEQGTALMVELSTKPNVVLRFFHMVVVHAAAKGKGRWLMSCAFPRPLSEDELRPLIEN
jgi:hypothetical protein